MKGLGGVWLIKDNWINGSIPRNVQPGNYYVKICDDQNDVISTDVYITAVVLATLQVSPSSGPGDVQVQLTGSGYPASQPVTISYFDDYAGWGYLRSVTADSNGQISFSQQMPDLGRSLGVGDNPEACNQQTFKAESGGYVAYADYNQTMRGIKNVGGEIASGLFGNGTYLGGSVRVGDIVSISGKWFHPNSAIYIRWDGTAIVGTVTETEWLNATIVGTTIADSLGRFNTTFAVPLASIGDHYIAIEDSQVKVILTLYLTNTSSLDITPPSGPARYLSK